MIYLKMPFKITLGQEEPEEPPTNVPTTNDAESKENSSSASESSKVSIFFILSYILQKNLCSTNVYLLRTLLLFKHINIFYLNIF